MSELEFLGKEYYSLLEQQQFKEDKLDYSILENHKPFLEKLAQVNNSGISVFDLCKKEHVFTSYNFSNIFGYDFSEINEKGNDYFNSRVHPDDFIGLLKNGILLLNFYYQLPKEERTEYKFVNEYRILGKENKYVRVIEQHQALEIDNYGNVWLALGVIDISPDQTELKRVKSQIYNYNTGKLIPLAFEPTSSKNLSKREMEVLNLVKDGFLSKEISEKLSISVHTVNTHRQRVLEKLGANNFFEATKYASKLGLI
jgi:DNA-binding CsgD family transcriptional regulator